MICAKCSAQNDSDAKFCLKCGEPLNNAFAPVYGNQPANGSSVTLGIVSSVLSIISVVAIGIILIYNCLQFNTILREYGVGAYDGAGWFSVFNNYVLWALLSIVIAFCVVFSKKNSKSIPLVKGIDAFGGLITFIYGVFIYGSMKTIDILGLVFCVVGCAAAIIWLVAPKKSWIASILIIAETIFFVLHRYISISAIMSIFEILRLIGMLCLGLGMAIKGFQTTSESKIKQVDTNIFWIIVAVLQAISTVSFIISVI